MMLLILEFAQDLRTMAESAGPIEQAAHTWVGNSRDLGWPTSTATAASPVAALDAWADVLRCY